jgi:hypothetical protein
LVFQLLNLRWPFRVNELWCVLLIRHFRYFPWKHAILESHNRSSGTEPF